MTHSAYAAGFGGRTVSRRAGDRRPMEKDPDTSLVRSAREDPMDDVHILREPPTVSSDELFRKIRECLAGTGVMRAILFGSYARGQADSVSDVDLVLIERTDRPFTERGLAHLPLFDMGVGVDLLVYTPEEYERLKSAGNPLIERVEREGATVYERVEG
ncbi:MAG: hypothetical protein DMF49_04930 [Acidobacteria bacterium]|nr:MAG: hypothetical protein DMF49_04930 [Acidobacteriota bacterium]